MRQSLRARFHALLSRARQRKSVRVVALGQRLRHFADHVAHKAGVANGECVRRWFQEKKAGWYAVLTDPQMPVTSTLLLDSTFYQITWWNISPLSESPRR